jgi:pimeloyl-ACP methyl ester carboxylesterase
MTSSAFLWPAQLLPVNRLLEFDVNLKDALGTLKQTSVVIFQGELDKLARPEIVQEAVIGQPNVELIVVNGASHSNTVSKAGELYFLKLCQLLQCGD